MPQISIYVSDAEYIALLKHGKRSELIQSLLKKYFEENPSDIKA